MSADLRTDVEHHLRSLLDERLDGLSRRIREWLDESHARAGSLTQIIEEARREPLLVDTALVAADPAAGAEDLKDLATFAHEMECSSDQVAILGRLVSGASTHASRILVLVLRNENLIGWTARGFSQDFSPRRITLPLSQDTLLSRAHSSCAVVRETPSDRDGNEEFAATLGIETPREMMAVPLWVRDRVAALLYADVCDPDTVWRPDAIRLMASLTALCLEAIPARTKFPRPNAATLPLGDRTPRRPREATRAPRATVEEAMTPATEEIDPEEERHHEDARRFARLLVSEILLYNEKEIEEGRRHKDLYERLKEDIDRSRQMYLHRVSPHLPAGPDYFRQELVRTLADGDESALNVPWG